MPCVTLELSPSGLPIAIAISPTRSFDESAKIAGRRPAELDTLITARSSAGNVPTSVPLNCRPFEVVTVKLFAVPTTWAFVTMWPFASKTIPEPRPSPRLDLDDRRSDLLVDVDEVGLELRGGRRSDDGALRRGGGVGGLA